ncbi:unnamed protein product [Paramecium sonneborni]|uniref:Uncharacterized protein n=1 Tax=Paramecium sonneborni TaxID=65129 RepID=A0A8S1RUP2_9CILI|nr:unnamed protein product [Paramecium sonneborni]
MIQIQKSIQNRLIRSYIQLYQYFNQIIKRFIQKNIAQYFKLSKKADDSNDLIKEQQFIEENIKKEKSKLKQHNMDMKGGVLFRYMEELYEQVGEIKGQNSKDAIKELVAKIFIRIMKENREQFVPAYLFSILSQT